MLAALALAGTAALWVAWARTKAATSPTTGGALPHRTNPTVAPEDGTRSSPSDAWPTKVQPPPRAPLRALPPASLPAPAASEPLPRAANDSDPWALAVRARLGSSADEPLPRAANYSDPWAQAVRARLGSSSNAGPMLSFAVSAAAASGEGGAGTKTAAASVSHVLLNVPRFGAVIVRHTASAPALRSLGPLGALQAPFWPENGDGDASGGDGGAITPQGVAAAVALGARLRRTMLAPLLGAAQAGQGNARTKWDAATDALPVGSLAAAALAPLPGAAGAAAEDTLRCVAIGAALPPPPPARQRQQQRAQDFGRVQSDSPKHQPMMDASDEHRRLETDCACLRTPFWLPHAGVVSGSGAHAHHQSDAPPEPNTFECLGRCAGLPDPERAAEAARAALRAPPAPAAAASWGEAMQSERACGASASDAGETRDNLEARACAQGACAPSGSLWEALGERHAAQVQRAKALREAVTAITGEAAPQRRRLANTNATNSGSGLGGGLASALASRSRRTSSVGFQASLAYSARVWALMEAAAASQRRVAAPSERNDLLTVATDAVEDYSRALHPYEAAARAGGPLATSLLEALMAHNKAADAGVALLLVGDDDTIISLLGALGDDAPPLPGFLAHVSVELWGKADSPSASLRYATPGATGALLTSPVRARAAPSCSYGRCPLLAMVDELRAAGRWWNASACRSAAAERLARLAAPRGALPTREDGKPLAAPPPVAAAAAVAEVAAGAAWDDSGALVAPLAQTPTAAALVAAQEAALPQLPQLAIHEEASAADGGEGGGLSVRAR